MCLLSLMLLPMLGSPKFSAREAAEAVLIAQGDRSAVIVCLGMNHPDPEISVRCQRLYHERRRQDVLANLRWLDGYLREQGPLPWIDALPNAHPGRNDILSRCLYFGPNREDDADAYDEPWSAWRRGTRLYLRELVLEGADRREVAALLGVLRERSLRYDARGGYPPD